MSARASDPSGRSLEISLKGYANPDADNDFDGNRVLVHIEATDDRSWEAEHPALLTWELRELIDWLRAVGAGAATTPFFAGMEPELQFEAEPGGGVVAAILSRAFAPPGTKTDEEHPLLLELGAGEVRAFADALEEEAREVPVRAIEAQGYARKLLDRPP